MDPRAIEITPEEACEAVIPCQTVVRVKGKTSVKTSVIFAVDHGAPFPFWITDGNGDNPQHLGEGELVRVRLICPNCDSPFWYVGDVEEDMGGSELDKRECFQCFDCGWEGTPDDDWQRFRP